MTQAAIHKLLSSNVSIPTLPEIVLRINKLVQDPDIGTAEIGAVVAEDAPLAAKVLRIANSAYYGLVGECVSTEHASTVLGIRVLRNIVSQVGVMAPFEHVQGNDHFDVQRLWDHAIQTAHMCSFIAQRSKGPSSREPSEYYVCGLMHDVGKVVLLDGLKDRYLGIVEQAVKANMPLHIAEQRELEFNHTDVGALVASRWGLPAAISEAIQYHHGPEEVVSSNPLVALVARANELMHCVEENNPAAALEVLNTNAAKLLGLSGDDVDAILEKAQEIVSIKL